MSDFFLAEGEPLLAAADRYGKIAEDVQKFADFWTVNSQAQNGFGGIPEIALRNRPEIEASISRTTATLKRDETQIQTHLEDTHAMYLKAEQENVEESKRIWSERTSETTRSKDQDLRSRGSFVGMASEKLRPPVAEIHWTWEWVNKITTGGFVENNISSEVNAIIARHLGIDIAGFLKRMIQYVTGDWEKIAKMGDLARQGSQYCNRLSLQIRNDTNIVLGTDIWQGQGAELARNHCSMVADRAFTVVAPFNKIADAYESIATASWLFLQDAKSRIEGLLGIVVLAFDLVAAALMNLLNPQETEKVNARLKALIQSILVAMTGSTTSYMSMITVVASAALTISGALTAMEGFEELPE